MLRIYFYSQLWFLLTIFELLHFVLFSGCSRIIHCILFGMQFHFPLTAEFAIRLIYHLFMSSDKFNLIAECKTLRSSLGGKCICCFPHFKCNFWNGQAKVFYHSIPSVSISVSVLSPCPSDTAISISMSFRLSHSDIINVNGVEWQPFRLQLATPIWPRRPLWND